MTEILTDKNVLQLCNDQSSNKIKHYFAIQGSLSFYLLDIQKVFDWDERMRG